MENYKTLYYHRGMKKFPFTAPLCTAVFRIDAGAQAAGTDTTKSFPAGTCIVGFRAKVTEAVTSGGSATVQLGFSGKTMLSAAIAKATLVADYSFGPDDTADAAFYTCTAADTFDCIVGTATLTAGKFDVEVFYIPPMEAQLSSDIKEYTTE